MRAVCVIEGCDKFVHSRGWCPMHYQRWRHNGDPMTVLPSRRNYPPRRQGVEACAIEGCARVIKGRGWCAAHYSRWQRLGSPTARIPGEVVDGRKICRRCGEDKPLDDYGRKNDPCRSCQAGARRDYRRDNPGYRNSPAVRASDAAYRARKRVQTVEKFDPREVFDRDGWVCGICGLAIDPTLRFPNSMAVSLDHVIPLSLGGEHSRANAQASHLRCNSAKGNRVVVAPIGGAA